MATKLHYAGSTFDIVISADTAAEIITESLEAAIKAGEPVLQPFGLSGSDHVRVLVGPGIPIAVSETTRSGRGTFV